MQVKILIVDDEIEILSTLSNVFTTLLKGYLVLTATSANSGLSMIKEQQPDVVIVDVRLGPVSGMDLIRDYYTWIKDHGAGYRPVFIVITAYDDEEVKKKAEEYKVDAFLMKPLSREAILHAVIDGISKMMHKHLTALDSMKNSYKRSMDRALEIDKKVNGIDSKG